MPSRRRTREDWEHQPPAQAEDESAQEHEQADEDESTQLVEDKEAAPASDSSLWGAARDKWGSSYEVRFTEPPVRVVLNSTGQHTLEWPQPLRSGGTTIPAGSLNLYTFPGPFAGAELAIIRRVLLEIAANAPRLYETPDPVGAYVIHALCVCNTEESIRITVELCQVMPSLLLQTHSGQPFLGESLLHICAANRREALGITLLTLLVQSFDGDRVKALLESQAEGVFFDSAPMNFYGDSVLGYASVFGLKGLVRAVLDTGLTSLNDNCGKIVGFYPLHAVAANGLRGMYDFLTKGLPEGLRADKDIITEPGRLIHLSLDDMSPLQLTCRIGLRYMHQHIMRTELVRTLWVWGPVTQYQISLRGIDSSGDGACDVMEVLCREDAADVTREFILDEFMCGFLFQLYEQKWRKFGWYIHYVLCALDGSLVVAVVCLCINMKNETVTGERHQYGLCYLLVGILFAVLAVEAWLGYLYASNYKEGVPFRELFSRTWTWMEGFGISNNLTACSCILLAVGLYMVEPGTLDGYSAYVLPSIFHPESLEEVEASLSHGASAGSTGRRLDDSLDFTYRSEAQRLRAIHDYRVWSAEEARWDGIEPLMWLLLALGFLLKFYAFLEKTVMPFTRLYVLVLSIRQVLSGDLLIFMSLFVIFIGTFVTTLITIYPDHKMRGELPQAEEFMHPFAAVHAILMAGFTGEPLDFNLHPDFLAPLGAWQKLNLCVFFLVYVLYIFLSLILLLNLLIALLGSTFQKTQNDSVLHGRMAFARNVLRLERIAEVWGIVTHAGDPDGEDPDGEPRYVHNFRDVKMDESAELPRDWKSENVFDVLPAEGEPQTPPPKVVEESVSFLQRVTAGSREESPAGARPGSRRPSNPACSVLAADKAGRAGAKPPTLKISAQHGAERGSLTSPFASARTPRSVASQPSPLPSARKADGERERPPPPPTTTTTSTQQHQQSPTPSESGDAHSHGNGLAAALGLPPAAAHEEAEAEGSQAGGGAGSRCNSSRGAGGDAGSGAGSGAGSDGGTPRRSVTISTVPQESAAAKLAGDRLSRAEARSPRESVRRAASLAASPLGVPAKPARPTTIKPAVDNYEAADATAAMIKQATPRTANALHEKLVGGSLAPNAYATKAREAGVPHSQVAAHLRSASPARKKKAPAPVGGAPGVAA